MNEHIAEIDAPSGCIAGPDCEDCAAERTLDVHLARAQAWDDCWGACWDAIANAAWAEPGVGVSRAAVLELLLAAQPMRVIPPGVDRDA